MNLLVTLLGVFAILIGLIGLVRPHTLGALIQAWEGGTRFWFAVGLRIAMGIALMVVAPACRIPLVVQILGGIAIVAGVIIWAAGRSRLDHTIAWWIGDETKLRISSLFALAMGVLFVYVAG